MICYRFSHPMPFAWLDGQGSSIKVLLEWLSESKVYSQAFIVKPLELLDSQMSSCRAVLSVLWLATEKVSNTQGSVKRRLSIGLKLHRHPLLAYIDCLFLCIHKKQKSTHKCNIFIVCIRLQAVIHACSRRYSKVIFHYRNVQNTDYSLKWHVTIILRIWEWK